MHVNNKNMTIKINRLLNICGKISGTFVTMQTEILFFWMFKTRVYNELDRVYNDDIQNAL